jgi:non-specific serine/threonine protein kinase
MEAAAAMRTPTNLPERGARLIGRERELEQITAILRGDEVQLLTLTGPGGVGKTRLAVEARRFLLDAFADGVFVVNLAPLSDPKLIAPHVAEVFGLKEAPGTTIAEQLARHLSDKHLLLVLDNFEHLLEGASLVAELLGTAPSLRVLVTSRALLRVRAEREFEVEPLDVPSETDTPQALERTPAAALFVERAREAKPSFALTETNAGAVAGICRRLEGLPLAIELAAARMRLLTVDSLLARLDERLRLLTSGARDLPERQRTMRGAIQWSYDLLEETEQVLLRRLAVFAGGCTLEAAEGVCGNEERGTMNDELKNSGTGFDSAVHRSSFIIHRSAVLDVLESLLDKSLLRQREQPDGEARFLMLEVVREFAAEQLEASGEAGGARQAHAHYFLWLAQEAEHKLFQGPQQAAWRARLGAEQDNVRAALGWLLEYEPEAGARMAAALIIFWLPRSLFREAREWLTRTIAANGAAAAALRAKLLLGLGNCERLMGNLDAAGAHAREAIEASRSCGDAPLLARSLNLLGMVFEFQKETRRAREALEEALRISRELGHAGITGMLLGNLGEMARHEGDFAAARAYYEQAHEVVAPHGRSELLANSLINLGGVSLEGGDTVGAGTFYREALPIATEIGNSHSCAMAIDGLAAVALAGGQLERAARLAAAVEALLEAIGVRFDPAEQHLHDSYVGKLREALEPANLEREWARGRAMTFDEAAQLALERTDG